MAEPSTYDKCFSDAFIHLNFTNVLVAVLVFVRLGYTGSLKYLFLRTILDITIQIPKANMCGGNPPISIEILWKVFDYSKLILYPMTTVYTVSLIANTSRLGKWKNVMIGITYFVWGTLWLTGLSLETACTLGGNCQGPMQPPAQDSTPRKIMGAAYLVVFIFDTLWALASVVDYFDWSKLEVKGLGIVKTFVANRLFRVFLLNVVSLIYYSINAAGGFSIVRTIAGAHSYRLLDTYTNVNLSLYFVEFLIAKIELKMSDSSGDGSGGSTMSGLKRQIQNSKKALEGILALAALAASAAHAAVPEFANEARTANYVPNVYAFHLAQGVDAEAAVKAHFAAQNLPIKIRTKVNVPDVANYISVKVLAPHTKEQVLGLAEATTAHLVHSIAAPDALPDATPFPEQAPQEEIHRLTGVNAARNVLGLRGAGVKACIIDSGIYHPHPALGGCFGPGCRIAFGYDLVGDGFGSTSEDPEPDNDPLDNCSASAHGTHVAGIIGANAMNTTGWPADLLPPVPFTGVAPEATLGAYRVFGCSGGTGTDIMASAIYMAAKDGCDVMNLSIGGGPNYAEDVSGLAAAEVGKKGHFVTGSNGNSGANGPFAQGGVGVNEGAIAVGSFDNLATPNPALNVDGKSFPLNFGGANSSFPAGDNTWDYVITDPDAEANKVNTEGCPGTPFKNSPRGKIAIIRFGVSGTPGFCGSAVRCNAAAAAGATACVIYAVDEVSLNIAGSALIPSAAISNSAGNAIVDAFKAGKPAVVTFNPDKQAMFPLATAATVSDFSSPGLDPELNIKPDIGGIGGQVLSTISPVSAGANKAPYGLLSGTSMSAPYVCGTMALLVEAKKKTITFEETKSRLVNNAKPAKIYKSDLIDSVTRQGGGLVNVYDAITAKTVVYPPNLSLNDTVRTQQHYTIEFTHEYTVPVTYTISSYGASMMTPFMEGDNMMLVKSKLPYTADYAKVTFRGMTSRSFRVQPGARGRANIDFEVPTNADPKLFPVFSGYITLTNDQDDQVIRVPYAGMVGDWSTSPSWVRKSPSLNAALTADPLFRALGFTNTSEASVGAFLADGSFTPVPTGVALNGDRDVLLLMIPAATTTRGYKVEIKYAGTDREVVKQLEALGIKSNWYAPIGIPDVETLALGPTGEITRAPRGALVSATVQRNAPSTNNAVRGPGVLLWSFQVYPNTTSSVPVNLPAGEYKLKFSAMKKFKRVGTIDANYDIFETNVFKIVY
ncbi:hypothetical protein HDV05_004595 [Chytridiales sp. JEL 0842]|nr:hypothetical protein HDV05_004595 [Chytridiales sp. JEL 0842]